MSRVSLVLHAAGLIAVYGIYGLLQEKIIKTSYGPNNERFNSSSLLILCNRLFAMLLAVSIIAFKKGRGTSLLQALNPTLPLSSFAIVALLNFLATTCQYEALIHLSFTTTSLAKCMKMIPVLLVQRLVYRQSPRSRDWIASVIVFVGCCTYLSNIKTISPLDSDDAFSDAMMGTFYLIGYLGFDALTSTTQEKYFGRNSSSTDPFAPESNVLPQMIYVNFFSSIFSLIGVLMTFKDGRVPSSILLLIHDTDLKIDVLLLSSTAALGLIILLNSIASFGALWTSCLMTVRQFIGILLNSGVWGNFGSVGLEGWAGVGWVASGVYIKMNKSYDNPLSLISSDEENGLLKERSKERSISPDPSPPYTSSTSSNSNRSSFSSDSADSISTRRLIHQYLIPVLLPVIIALIIWVVVPINTNSSNNEEFVDSTILEGGLWEHELHASLLPECGANNASGTVRWEGKTRTVLASFPRSGNTLTRELVERATNFQTSTVSYCDEFLRDTFIGECDHSATFLSKSHYPWKMADIDLDYRKTNRYDQGVHLVRNPIDALYSDWMLANVPKTPSGQLDHSGRIKIGLLGSTQDQRAHVLRRAMIWQHHEEYWHSIPIPIHNVRYEDLIIDRLPTMLSLIAFLLPHEVDRPDLTSISCMTELDEARQAYKSRKSKTFNTWELMEPNLRTEVMGIVRTGWCRRGYQSMFAEARPEINSGIVC